MRAVTKRAPKPPKKAASSAKRAVKRTVKKEAVKPTPQRAAPKKAAARPARRADFGAPTKGFFEKQPAALRPILEALRDMVEAAAPEAQASLKWGMPVYEIGDKTMCALGGHRSHVNLILAGPPGTFADPDGLLSGSGKTGRHLKLTSIGELPKKAVQGWLRTAAAIARKKAT
jgi:hypothetical protein